MSAMAINNKSVIWQDCPPLDSRAAITVGGEKWGFAPLSHTPLTRSHNHSLGYATGKNLPVALMRLARNISLGAIHLQQLFGLPRHRVMFDAPLVRPPQVPLQPLATESMAGDLPDLSSKRNGAKPDDIWGGFRQGPVGNCVTVSAIKAAMMMFGQSPTDIFKEVRKVGEGYWVVMRDGFTFSLSRKELAEGARGSRFVSRNAEMLKDAHFLFAASAKRAQLENNDGYAKQSFAAAVRSLNDGEDEYGPGEGLRRLGLRHHIKRVPVSELANGVIGMVNRRGHSAAVIDGVEELFGRRGGTPRQGEAIALK